MALDRHLPRLTKPVRHSQRWLHVEEAIAFESLSVRGSTEHFDRIALEVAACEKMAMSKLTWACGMSLAFAFGTGACSDSDEAPSGGAGASSGGRAGASGSSGSGGQAEQAGATSEAGTGNEAGQGGSAGEAGGAGGAGDSGGSGGSAGGEVDDLIGGCLPDGTELEVTATSDASAYVITGLPERLSDGEGDHNADLKLCRSYTYTFVINAAGHPFYFKLERSLGTADAYDTGVTNNGATKATITWTVAGTAPGVLYYQCSLHQAMGGTIDVVEPR